MVQQVKVFAAKCDDLSSIPGTQVVDRQPIPASCPLISIWMHALETYTHRYRRTRTHTHTGTGTHTQAQVHKNTQAQEHRHTHTQEYRNTDRHTK